MSMISGSISGESGSAIDRFSNSILSGSVNHHMNANGQVNTNENNNSAQVVKRVSKQVHEAFFLVFLMIYERKKKEELKRKNFLYFFLFICHSICRVDATRSTHGKFHLVKSKLTQTAKWALALLALCIKLTTLNF